MYLTIKENGENEIIINKSRFICSIYRANTEAEAMSFIKRIKKINYNATHNCSAYIVGENGIHQKANDDGEPSGTAGIPMLEVLRKNHLTDTVCVVTRYFGGTKLGAGGLIRAYGQAVSQVINKIGIIEKRKMRLIEVEADYAQIGLLDSKFTQYLLINKVFLEKVYYTYQIDLNQVQLFIDYLVDLTKNNISYQLKDITMCEVIYEKH
ncbi:YigZ family protein [Mycoplasmatota bacterium]|nr:YigZ family protein [Mycoplasmatota bacterium]